MDCRGPTSHFWQMKVPWLRYTTVASQNVFKWRRKKITDYENKLEVKDKDPRKLRGSTIYFDFKLRLRYMVCYDHN